MKKTSLFSDVLDATENFSVDAIEELSDILHKRAIELRRLEISGDIKAARSDLKSGRAKVYSAKDIIKELVA
jgi:hypothetical protein